jgi:hypothetical protein
MSNVPNNVVITEDTPNTIIINQDAANQVVVRLGSAAGNTRRHIHVQEAASATWTITHSLGGKPSIVVVDSADTVVIGEVKYDSNTQLRVFFSAEFSGKAYLT